VGAKFGVPALHLEADVSNALAGHVPGWTTGAGEYQPGVFNDQPDRRVQLHREQAGGHLHPDGGTLD
jgi:hypothetical protein